MPAVDSMTERLVAVMAPSTAIVCVGNTMRGDDAAGPEVARRLAGCVPWAVYNTQTAPESFLMKIARGEPESVILIDAIAFDAPPGSVELFAPDDLSGQGPSTHGPAPLTFLEAMAMVHPCRLAVVGIRPDRTDMGAPLSAPVAAAVKRVVQAFCTIAQSGG